MACILTYRAKDRLSCMNGFHCSFGRIFGHGALIFSPSSIPIFGVFAFPFLDVTIHLACTSIYYGVSTKHLDKHNEMFNQKCFPSQLELGEVCRDTSKKVTRPSNSFLSGGGQSKTLPSPLNKPGFHTAHTISIPSSKPTTI